MIPKILNKFNFNLLEEFLLKIGPVRFITFILFPILLALCSYSYEQGQGPEDYIVHILIFCLYINDFISGSWREYRSNYLKATNSVELESLNFIKFSNLKGVIYLGKKVPLQNQTTVFMRKNIFNKNDRSFKQSEFINDIISTACVETKASLEQSDPKWISPQMKKNKQDNIKFVLALSALISFSFVIDFAPLYIQNYFFSFISIAWSFVLIREIHQRTKIFNISKKFVMVCYQLAFVVFVMGFVFIQK